MSNIESICPVCDADITISERDIKIAVKRRGDTEGQILLTCPACCRVLVPNEGAPEGDAELIQWIVQQAEDGGWLPCVPMLDPMLEKMPAGYVEHLGVKEYRPGAGDDPLPRRAYMLKYGIDPECSLRKQRGG